MASASPPIIRFDQLKSRYSIDVADDTRTPSLIANLGRSNLAADAAVVLWRADRRLHRGIALRLDRAARDYPQTLRPAP